MIPFGLYQGSRSEYLATYILSRLCVVTPVRREGDFGVDIIGHLARRVGRRLEVGEAFGIQVKSEDDQLGYPEKPEDKTTEQREQIIRWLFTQPIPFFVAVVSKDSLRLRLYSTWELLKLSYEHGYAFRQVVLALGPGQSAVATHPEGDVGTVFLGPPIIDVAANDVEDNAKADDLASVLEYWVRLDLENVMNRVAGVCYIQGHKQYTTNKKPETIKELCYVVGSPSLPALKRRLATVATVTALALRTIGVSELEEGLRRAAPLRGALETCKDDLDPYGHMILDQLGQAS